MINTFQYNDAKGLKIDEMDSYIESRELLGEGMFYVAHKYISNDDNESYELWIDQDGDIKIVELNSAVRTFLSKGYKG